MPKTCEVCESEPVVVEAVIEKESGQEITLWLGTRCTRLLYGD